MFQQTRSKCYYGFPRDSSEILNYNVTILLRQSDDVSQTIELHNVTLVPHFLVYSDDGDVRMWLLWHPTIDAIHKPHVGNILEQSRRRIVEPTIGFLIVTHVRIRISGVKIHITLSLVVNITLIVSNIDQSFFLLPLANKPDISIRIGHMSRHTTNSSVLHCLYKSQMLLSFKTDCNGIGISSHLNMIC